MSAQHVDVVVHFPALPRTVGPGQLRVQVENTSEADAPAIVVSRLVVDLLSLDLTFPETLRFELPYTGAGADLTVSAVFAVDTSRPPSPGDLVTPATVRVRPDEPVHVHLVEYRGV
jgi:hypothetical protein